MSPCKRGHDRNGGTYANGTCKACAIAKASARVKSMSSFDIQAWHRKYRYGLGAEEYQRMYDTQGGLCAICRVGWAALVDHDHVTGRVRGLLCRRCNTGMGMLGDGVDRLGAAITYLRSA